MEQPVGAQPVAHGVGEAGQLDAVRAHHAHAAKLKVLGKIEHGLAVEQCHKCGIGRERHGAGLDRSRDPYGRDPATDDTLAGIGLEPIHARGFIREALPDRQQQTGNDMDLAIGELRHVRDLCRPGPSEGLAVGFLPMGLRHHGQRDSYRIRANGRGSVI